LERRLDRELEWGEHEYQYEACRIPYSLECHYVPDYILMNGILIEAKGHFTSADRRKMRAVKARHPLIEIRFVFGRASNKLNKTSRTTYSKWCETKGFPWANKSIPDSWHMEPPFKQSIAALAELGVTF
jgi:hypothetical protein